MALSLDSIKHVNVNCSDLERSLLFYRDLVGLTPLSHTNPLPQEGVGFGLPGKVVWDAFLLHDDRGADGPAIDLLQWQTPVPVGRPNLDAHNLGYMRLCFAHPDLDSLHARCVDMGIKTRSAPVSVPVIEGHTVRFFCCDDPDGTCVEFIERPGPARMSHININCRNLDESAAWYQQVLGVKTAAPRAEPPPAQGAGFGFSGDCSYRADFFSVDGDNSSYIIDLLEWTDPKPVGEPLAEANHLGVFRMAFMVEDATASCVELDRLGIEHSGPCLLEMGPEVPIEGGLLAVFFRDPDGACLELIEKPRMKT